MDGGVIPDDDCDVFPLKIPSERAMERVVLFLCTTECYQGSKDQQLRLGKPHEGFNI